MHNRVEPKRRVARCILRAAWLALALAVPPLGAVAENGPRLPAPVLDETAGDTRLRYACSCWWMLLGRPGVFQHMVGVTSAVSGYAGGDKSTARYDKVTTGATGHAEAVRITYDPRRISYGRLL